MAAGPRGTFTALSSRKVLLALCLALSWPGAAEAGDDEPPPSPAAERRRHVVATRAPAGITLDGALDEPGWAATPPVSDLWQKTPTYGATPAYRTEIRVLFSGSALYIGARMWNAPGATRTAMTRRDQTRDAERFIVSLDPYRTGRLAYSFAVTVAGVRADWIHTDDNEFARDASWDPVWSASTRVLPDGWSAELRIPWTQLRYPLARGDEAAPAWGINFNRYIPDRNEDIFWIAVPPERTAWASYMGELRGLAGLPRTAGIELLPYVVGSVAIGDPGGGGAPDDGPDFDGNLGLDAKLGLGAGLTLDVAINPDFGQVEADPAIVNLSAFEVSLPERRPFFVAGNEIFASAPRSYFYSRRVGAGDQRILGAAKLSGRLGNRTTIGALTAVTDDRGLAGDLTGWTAARITRELGASRIGATVAAVGRSLDDDEAPPPVPRPDASMVAGIDGLHRWADGEWELLGHLGASGLWGDAAAVERIQRSSTHYFQRPDAEHTELDPTRTSLGGWHAATGLARRAGRVQGDGSVVVESPGFDTNGTGILSSADEIAANARVGWNDTTPSKRWQAWNVSLAGFSGWTFGGERRQSFLESYYTFVTPGFVELSGNPGFFLPAYSDSATRGGPLVKTPGGFFYNGYASSRGSSTTAWSIGWDVQHGQKDGLTSGRLNGTISLRPDDRLRIELSPRAIAFRDRLQYVATADGGPTATFGQRYIFATLDLREVSVVLRTELTLTPDLSIDLYIEPFVSTGAYTRLAELTAASTHDLRRYSSVTRNGTRVTIDDGAATFELPEPDFTIRSLRSTAVLRWEPRPGSTLYAVWQQGRGSSSPRAHAVGPALVDAITAPGGHTFAIKLAWWYAR